jgi:TrpR-related protein YerC/YecD
MTPSSVVREQEKNNERLTRLYKAFLTLKTEKECANFLRDLCTLSEIEAMAERLTIAELLNKDTSYRAASDTVGASTTTVTRVAHWLHHGMGGYRTVLSRFKQ